MCLLAHRSKNFLRKGGDSVVLYKVTNRKTGEVAYLVTHSLFTSEEVVMVLELPRGHYDVDELARGGKKTEYRVEWKGG